MWQRFTKGARKAVFYAQEEAQRTGEGFVSTEHLLLGLVREEDGIAIQVLATLGLTHDQVRAEVEKHPSSGDPRPNADMTLTPRSKRVIDLACEEARNLNHNYVGAEHLLLGLIKEGDGVAGRVLNELGIGLDKARLVVFEMGQKEVEGGGRGAPTPSPSARPSHPAHGITPPADPWLGIDPFARRAIVFADVESLQRGQAFLSPEHLLLGLLREPGNPAVRVLACLGFDPEAIRIKVATQCRDSGSPLRSESTLSPASGNAFRIAYQEQVRLRTKELGVEHLLLGLLIEPDGIAGRILEDLGLDADRVRASIVAEA